MKKLSVAIGAIALTTGLFLIACSKDNSNDSNGGPTTVKIRMTDAPASYEQVNVDVAQVRVKFRDDMDSVYEWQNLDTHAGVYNLLGLTGGVDTLLAVGTIPTNTVKEIRLVLGSDNTIKVGGVVYPLSIPSGSESGLKIKVDKRLNGSLDSLLVDFDAALSVHQLGTGQYQLKPVLRIK